jgi:hypothetical protein
MNQDKNILYLVSSSKSYFLAPEEYKQSAKAAIAASLRAHNITPLASVEMPDDADQQGNQQHAEPE